LCLSSRDYTLPSTTVTTVYRTLIFASTTTSRAVTVSTRGCTYRLPGSFRQFPLRGSIYARSADIQMFRLQARQPCRRLCIVFGRSESATRSCLSQTIDKKGATRTSPFGREPAFNSITFGMTLMLVRTDCPERCAAILKHKKIIIGDDPPEVNEQSDRNVLSKA